MPPRLPKIDSPRTGAVSLDGGAIGATGGGETLPAGASGDEGGAMVCRSGGGVSRGGASVAADFAEIVGGAVSLAFAAGGGAVGASGAEPAPTRVRIGAVRGGGGGGNVAVAATGEERTARVSTKGAGALGFCFVEDASIHALSLAISSSSKLASAEPLPGMPALLQNSTSSLLSIFKSFASA